MHDLLEFPKFGRGMIPADGGKALIQTSHVSLKLRSTRLQLDFGHWNGLYLGLCSTISLSDCTKASTLLYAFSENERNHGFRAL